MTAETMTNDGPRLRRAQRTQYRVLRAWYCVLLTSAFLLLRSSLRAAEPAVTPLANAHAHNDYAHRRPLLDALDQGFCSVEADIFLQGGKLVVAHDAIFIRPERTLESLYLAPLRERARANGGRVYRDGPPFWLLVDIKSDAESTYAALDKLLATYDDIITKVENVKPTTRAVNVVISGNRPVATIGKQMVRYAGIDGRLDDLDSDAAPHLMPWISDNWTKHFRWRGKGEMPAAEREKLDAIVAQAHKAGRKLRFWATPDTPELWRTLVDAKVNFINTDDLAGLRKVLDRR
jgi:hypothetical protein